MNEEQRIENMLQQLFSVGANDINITAASTENDIYHISFTLNGVSMRAQANGGETRIYGIGIDTYNGIEDLAQLIGGAK